jgi:redox-sensitive bicupin YhaK (pirin superfamily)
MGDFYFIFKIITHVGPGYRSTKSITGTGMDVRRILPFRLRRMVGPFIFMDHAGPVDIITSKAKTMDVLPHPHIGLSTVSYLFGGQVTHRDSTGAELLILPG